MSINFTISDKQISAIHNTVCYMNSMAYFVDEMFKKDSDISKSFQKAFETLKPVRDELMALKDAHDDKIREMADRYAKTNDFSYTIWSIYDIDNFLESSNVPSGATIVSDYDDRVSVVAESNSKYCSWIELWKAVEKLASKTIWDESGRRGFGDHVFIEKFVEVKDKPNTYEVWLGS